MYYIKCKLLQIGCKFTIDGGTFKKFVTVVDGIGSFKLSLGLIGKLNSDIWIAYATRKNPRPYPEPEYRDDIPWDKSKWPEDKREEFSEYEKREKLFRDSRMQDRDIEMTFSVLLNHLLTNDLVLPTNQVLRPGLGTKQSL